MKPCRWTSISQRFEGSWCVHLQGQVVFFHGLTLKMKLLRTFEVSYCLLKDAASHPGIFETSATLL
jgi:hypothetical protein